MHNRQTDRETERDGHTVETGHYVGLTAITSKVIWTPDGRKQNQREREKKGETQRKEREREAEKKRAEET